MRGFVSSANITCSRNAPIIEEARVPNQRLCESRKEITLHSMGRNHGGRWRSPWSKPSTKPKKKEDTDRKTSNMVPQLRIVRLSAVSDTHSSGGAKPTLASLTLTHTHLSASHNFRQRVSSGHVPVVERQNLRWRAAGGQEEVASRIATVHTRKGNVRSGSADELSVSLPEGSRASESGTLGLWWTKTFRTNHIPRIFRKR